MKRLNNILENILMTVANWLWLVVDDAEMEKICRVFPRL